MRNLEKGDEDDLPDESTAKKRSSEANKKKGGDQGGSAFNKLKRTLLIGRAHPINKADVVLTKTDYVNLHL